MALGNVPADWIFAKKKKKNRNNSMFELISFVVL